MNRQFFYTGSMSKAKAQKDKAATRLLGVWDTRKAPLTLGGSLIFIEELLIECRLRSLKQSFDIALTGPLPVNLPTEKPLSREDVVAVPALAVFFEFDVVRDVFAVTQSEAAELAGAGERELWPLVSDGSYRYGTTLPAQKYFREHGQLPDLPCGLAARKRAWEFYRDEVHPALPVVIHLKNASGRPSESNADLDAWYHLFSADRTGVKFIMIGNEDPGERFRALPNVVLTQDRGHDLGRDLGLIEMALVFMGMASGPANLAIFNAAPYVIFKNPDHHAAEMKEELGERDHVCFARPLQKILRVKETGEGLVRGWTGFFPYLNPQDWQARIQTIYHK